MENEVIPKMWGYLDKRRTFHRTKEEAIKANKKMKKITWLVVTDKPAWLLDIVELTVEEAKDYNDKLQKGQWLLPNKWIKQK